MVEEAEARRIVDVEDERIEADLAPPVARKGGVAQRSAESDEEVVRLRAALDTLDGKVKLLLERHALLAQRYAGAVAARRESEERVTRMSAGGLDPRELEERLRDLETRHERLMRHAGYLEDRIEGLLARVRYVVET